MLRYLLRGISTMPFYITSPPLQHYPSDPEAKQRGRRFRKGLNGSCRLKKCSKDLTRKDPKDRLEVACNRVAVLS